MGQFIEQDTPALVTTTSTTTTTSNGCSSRQPQPQQDQDQDQQATRMLAAMRSSLMCSSRTLRSVRFENEITVIDDHNDYEAEEEVLEEEEEDNDDYHQDTSSSCNLLWYTQEDYNEFRAQNLVYLQRGRQAGCFEANNDSELAEEEEWTSRGFEYVTHRYPRKQIRMEHSMCVLDFQDVLGGSGNCPTALAEYATNSSTANGSQSRAQNMGLLDERIAKRIHHDQQQQPYVVVDGVLPTTTHTTITTTTITPATNNNNNKTNTTTATALVTTSSDRYHVPVVIGWSMSMIKFFRCF